MLLEFEGNYTELVHLLLFCYFDKRPCPKATYKKRLVLAYISRDMKACPSGEGMSVDRHGSGSRKLAIIWSSTQRKEGVVGERNRKRDKSINYPLRKAVSSKYNQPGTKCLNT